VVAVGAVDVHDPGLDDVELFSSRGPARIDFPTLEIRAKPDLVAFDGVAISNAGGFPACPPFCAFFGTSAAAPHSAGVAALLLDQDPTLTPAQVQSALTRGAVDIGAPGFDATSGFGRLDAVAAADTLRPACLLDVDRNGTVDVSTDIVYIARTLLGLTPVPPSFRASDQTIPQDSVVAGRVAAAGNAFDVDGSGSVAAETDVVYIARTLLGLTPVPPSFRTSDSTIPSDTTIAGAVKRACP